MSFSFLIFRLSSVHLQRNVTTSSSNYLIIWNMKREWKLIWVREILIQWWTNWTVLRDLWARGRRPRNVQELQEVFFAFCNFIYFYFFRLKLKLMTRNETSDHVNTRWSSNTNADQHAGTESLLGSEVKRSRVESSLPSSFVWYSNPCYFLFISLYSFHSSFSGQPHAHPCSCSNIISHHVELFKFILCT